MSGCFYSRDGKTKLGPVAAMELQSLAKSGRLSPTDMVFMEDMDKWVQANQVTWLFPTSRPSLPEALPIATVLPEALPVARTVSAALPTPLWFRPTLAGLVVVVAVSGVIYTLIKLSGSPNSVVKNTTFNNADAMHPKSESAKVSDQVPSLSTGTPGTSKPMDQPSGVPDFAQVDYAFDFTKDDYESIPAGAKRHTRKQVIDKGDESLLGKTETENGYIDSAGKFVTHGSFITWRDKAETEKLREGKELHGKLHGVMTFYHQNGKKLWDMPFVQNKKHGIVRTWHSNGRLSAEEMYFEGHLHGVSKVWHENGKLEFENTWVNGKKHGPHKQWSDDGTPKKAYNYRNDALHGLCIAYAKDAQGKLYEATRCRVEQNRLVGKATFGYWSGSGQVYYVDVTEGRWKGGRIEEFIAKMQYGIEGTEYAGQFLPRENIATFEAPSQESFFDFFGSPVQDQPHPDVFGKPPQIQRLVRRWVYQCLDGPLVLKAQISNQSGKVVVTTRPDYR